MAQSAGLVSNLILHHPLNINHTLIVADDEEGDWIAELEEIEIRHAELNAPAPGINNRVGQALARLAITQLLLAVMLALDGFGPPDKGRDFSLGGKLFEHWIGSILANAEPDSHAGWSGAAADEYAGLNGKLRQLVLDMAEKDRDSADALKARAPLVMKFRTVLGELELALIAAMAIATGLYLKYKAAMTTMNFESADWYSNVLNIFSITVAYALLIPAVVEAGYLIHASYQEKFKDAMNAYKHIASNAHALQSAATSVPGGLAVGARPAPSGETGAAGAVLSHAAVSVLAGGIAPDSDRRSQPIFSPQISPAQNAVQYREAVARPLANPAQRPASRSQRGTSADWAITEHGDACVALRDDDADGREGRAGAPGMPRDLAASADAAQRPESGLAAAAKFS